MTTPSYVDIRARVEAATEGPWEVLDDDDFENTTIRAVANWFEAYGHRQYGVRFVAELAEGNPNEADAEFIAHARVDIPRLLDAIDRVRALHAHTIEKNPLGTEFIDCAICGFVGYVGMEGDDTKCPTIAALDGEA